MELPELLLRIKELQLRIVAAGPLSPETKRKLDYRFSLDWNYHSNVMEGSSLTKQETRTIMLGNVTVQGKPIKDVLEMQGHNDVVTKLLHMASGELNLSEARIKEVHKTIVHEDDPAKKDWGGKWKSEPNYLTNFKGERMDFTPPGEVADAMHKLLDRTKADIERIERKARDAPHPAVLAFDFHREYVTIHPFHDGNGRTARIFSNLLLMRFGYPPVVVKVGEKETYNRYLAEVQAYGASPDLFNAFMAERLVRAQELVIDAIEGRSLEEADDLAKRAELLFLQAEGKRLTKEQQQEKESDLIDGWLEMNHATLITRVRNTFQPIGHFFTKVDYCYLLQEEGQRVGMPTYDSVGTDHIRNYMKLHPGSQIGMVLTFSGFKFGSGIEGKKVVCALRFTSDEAQLYWYTPKKADVFSYGEPVTDQAMPVMKQVAEALLKDIEKHINTP